MSGTDKLPKGRGEQMNKRRNETKLTRLTRQNRLGIFAALAIMFAIVGSVQVAEAKTYYTLYDVRYNNDDITPWLRPYIDHIEFDLEYGTGHGYGARLYFTGNGKYIAKYDSGASAMARYVMSLPEWEQSRSEKSVTEEIKYHAWWPGKWVVHIEYYCAELQSWEIYRKYC